MSETQEMYVWGDEPDAGESPSLGEVSGSIDDAVRGATEWLSEFHNATDTFVQYVYRLVPVKIVRRAGVTVEDVS